MCEKNQERIRQIARLEGTGWNLWRFYEDRADTIRARLWTVGSWLIALMGAVLVFLFQYQFLGFQRPFPGIVVLKPWPSAFIALVGLVLALLTCSIVWDSMKHIRNNFTYADYVWSNRWSPASLTRQTRAGALALMIIAGLFLLANVWVLALSAWSLAAGGPGGHPAAAAGSARVTLLTINDVYRIGGLDRGQRGGLARVRSLRKELEAEDPQLLVLHAGDVIYPSLLSSSYNGAQMIDVLNRLDGDPRAFDAHMFAVFGNHEFDKTKLNQAGILADRVRESQFTWLRSNFSFATDPGVGVPLVRGPDLRESTIVEANGIKVGLFGLTIDVTHPLYVLAFDDPVKSARWFSRELRRRGADVVVALTHLTVQDDMAILKELGVEGPDLIIGGHEHTMHKEEPVDGRYVLKADADAAGAWVVRITPRHSGQPPLVEPEYRLLAGDRPVPDPELAQDVAAWEARHDLEYCAADGKPRGCLNDEIGKTATVLVAAEEQIRSCETNFGDWIADQMLAHFPRDPAVPRVAFINAGSLRLNQNIAKGPILRRDLAELIQFDNELAVVPITGATLSKVVQNAIRDWPGNGRWLQISGFAFEHDQSDDEAPKLTKLELIGSDGELRPVQDKDTVQVVTTDYLLGKFGKGGARDDYDMLPAWEEPPEGAPKHLLSKVIEDALKAAGKPIEPPDPTAARRIVQVKPEPPCVAAR
jgi:2',3'-cyclic-nucleotide 2'-phosphodiesterase (5'-nucleotidase family)